VFVARGADLGWGFEHFPMGCCTNASVVLGNHLAALVSVPVTLMLGVRDGGKIGDRHHWITVDGWSIDVTADQFDPSRPYLVERGAIWSDAFPTQSDDGLRPIAEYRPELQKLFHKFEESLREYRAPVT
jgi:hypothetical protein